MIRALLFSSVVSVATVLPYLRPAPTYDATFTVAQQVYTGTAAMAVDRRGAVTGKLQLSQPAIVIGVLGGAVKSGTWTFEYPYEIPALGCAGTVKGTATFAPDRKTVSGTATVGGACTDKPESATFTFKLRERR